MWEYRKFKYLLSWNQTGLGTLACKFLNNLSWTPEKTLTGEWPVREQKVFLQFSVIGTPGEEGYYGKIKLLDRGAFKDLDCAMMVHPNGVNTKARAAALNCLWYVSHRIMNCKVTP